MSNDLPMATTMESKTYENRPYLRIVYECCQVYQRVYRDISGRFYLGRCPRCLRAVRFEIAPGGTQARDFIVH